MNQKDDNYQAWRINPNHFPYDGSLEDQVRFLAGYGVLAPSMHNTQPWELTVQNNKLLIKPDENRALRIGDPDGNGIGIAIGAFAENTMQAAKEYGFSVDMTIKDRRAEIAFRGSPSKPHDQTLQTITSRSSVKTNYSSKEMPSGTVEELRALSDEDIEVKVVGKGKIFDQIVDNHIKAASKIAKDPAFGKELANWLRPNDTKDSYGMPGFVSGVPKLKSKVAPKVLSSKPALLQKMALKDKELLNSASAFVVISRKNPRVDPIEEGRIIERAWLKLVEHGLAAHPLYAAIQDESGRAKLGELIGGHATPRFFMRVGYSFNSDHLHTPRAITNDTLQSALSNLAKTLECKPVGHTVRIKQYDINYVVAGAGPPVLLIHGANIGWPQWHLNLDELAKHFTVYAIDLPGAGDSTKIKFRKANFEKDFLSITDKFIQKLNLHEITLVGSSFGGWIALKLAIAKKPYIKKLIVTNPIGFTNHIPMKFRPAAITPLAFMMSKTALKPTRDNKNLEKFMRNVFHKQDTAISAEFIDYFYELSKHSHNLLFINRLSQLNGMSKGLYLGKKLKKISVPTLVIWGKEDPLMPLAKVRKAMNNIPDANINILDDVGHMPPVEAPEKVDDLIINFTRA